MKNEKLFKFLKVGIIVLDVIGVPLLLVQLIGGNFNISGIFILLVSNVIVFSSAKTAGKMENENGQQPQQIQQQQPQQTQQQPQPQQSQENQ